MRFRGLAPTATVVPALRAFGRKAGEGRPLGAIRGQPACFGCQKPHSESADHFARQFAMLGTAMDCLPRFGQTKPFDRVRSALTS